MASSETPDTPAPSTAPASSRPADRGTTASTLEVARREKLAKLEELGVDPWGHRFADVQAMGELREQAAEFADAVAMIKQLGDEVEQETSEGIPANPFKAHQALDKADLVLQWLPQIARDSGVAKEDWEAVNTSANELRTLLEQVHQNIDNKQDPDFAAVADTIAQELAELEKIPVASPDENE